MAGSPASVFRKIPDCLHHAALAQLPRTIMMPRHVHNVIEPRRCYARVSVLQLDTLHRLAASWAPDHR